MLGSISFRMNFSAVGWIFLLQAELFCFFWNVEKWKGIHCPSSHQQFVLRDHPFKTSAFFRGGGVKNLPNLPTEGGRGQNFKKNCRRLKWMVPKEASFVSGVNRRQVDERTMRAPKMAGGIPACSFTVPMYIIKGAIVVPICKICMYNNLKFCYQCAYKSTFFYLADTVQKTECEISYICWENVWSVSIYQEKVRHK